MLRPTHLFAALGAALSLASPALAADGVFKPRVLRAPGTVAAGDTRSITFDAGLATRCSLRFAGPRRAKSGPFATGLRGGILRASFRVHRRAAAGRWRGSISCKTGNVRRTTKLKLRVRGSGRTRGPLVARRSFRLGVGRLPGDHVGQTLTGQKNEPAPDTGQRGAGPYDNARIADIGLARLGSRAGECKPAVNDWVREASGGGQRLGGDYYSNHAAQGGHQVSRDEAVKGDIIQLHNPADERGYYWPMHSAVVVSHQPGSNVFEVVDSNYRLDGIVRRHAYDPYREAARRLQVTIWRMGTVSGDDGGRTPGIAGSGWQTAFQSSGGTLWTVGGDNRGEMGLGMAPGTSPSITGVSGGGWQTAFQASGGSLWVIGKDDKGDLGLGMKAGTSPSITGLSGGGWQAAFQSSGGSLWVVGADNKGDMGLGMKPGTSPSIAAMSGGGWQTAFQSSSGSLWVVGKETKGDMGLGVAPGTSPSITGVDGGGWQTAFQSSGGSLWVVGQDTKGDMGLGMAPGTSPSITGLAGGGWQAAFQANDNSLWVVGGDNRGALNLGMKPGTSPSITGIAGGGWQVAFQAPDGGLWVVGSDSKGALNLGMAAGTSPAITSYSPG